jgi:octaprenyl-diphosphate synthase
MVKAGKNTHMNEIISYLEKDIPEIEGFIARQVDGLDPLVREVAGHVLGSGGKRLRPALTLICARALGAPGGTDLLPLACSLEFLHSATLLHDDILDGATMRRSRETAHKLFGVTPTVLAGDVLLALANRLAADYGDARITHSLAEAIMGTATGEVREISAARNAGLSREDYMEIITAKTALLFHCACRCGALAAGAQEDLIEAAAGYGLNLGISFQLVDDALDYSAPPDVAGKPAGGDLREGKMTLPLMLYLDGLEDSARRELIARIEKGGLRDEEVADIVSRVEALGLPEKTRREAGMYADRARGRLAAFPESPEKTLMDNIVDFVLVRSK